MLVVILVIVAYLLIGFIISALTLRFVVADDPKNPTPDELSDALTLFGFFWPFGVGGMLAFGICALWRKIAGVE